MKTPRQILEEFAKHAQARCAFTGKSGVRHEGYIFEVREDALLFADSTSSGANTEPSVIPIDEIDLRTLSYFDRAKEIFVGAIWDDTKERWANTWANPPQPVFVEEMMAQAKAAPSWWTRLKSLWE